jgi:excinuclease UvrABC ATPase subunit
MTLNDLKNNQKPWKWVTPEQKEELLSAKKHRAMVFMDKNGYWKNHKGAESMGVVYRISKHYKEKPSYPELPIRCTSYETQSGIAGKVNQCLDCLESIYERLENLEARP